MNHVNRRNFLLGTVAFGGLLALGLPALALDAAKLAMPPASGEMAMGPADAKVTIIEYASASCPHCAAFHRDVFGTLKKDYIDTGKVRFVFREFPHNDAAMAAFMLARCAPKESYFPLVDVFFQTQDTWLASPREGLLNIAKQAGFTEETFDKCLKDETVAKAIMDVRTQGEGFGVTGIPTFFINGELYEGDRTIEAFKAKIDPLLG